MVNEHSRLHPVDATNLRDHIEAQLRDAILAGEFKPGERLVELTIAEQLGVSRAPVREALSALEREGLVVSIPRRGYSVIDFDDRDIEEIYSLRYLLEIAAMRRTMERFSPELRSELQGAVDALGLAIEQKKDYPSLALLDLAFHEILCRAADHSRLYSAWHTMRMQTWLLIGLTSRTHGDRPYQQSEAHQALLEALVNRDIAKVESLLHEHFEDAQQRARRALRELRPNESLTK